MNSSILPIPTPSPDPVSELIQQLLASSPSLATISQDDLNTVAKAVVLDELKDELKHRLDVARIDVAAKKEAFLAHFKSLHTQHAYGAALQNLESWAARAGVMLLDFKPRHADAYIASCTGSPSSIRLWIAAASSFFTFLDRETEGRIRNPFLGTKIRPIRASAIPQIPTASEAETIISAAERDLKAACIAVIEHGFRVGALPTIQIWGIRYQGISKGKQVSGTLTERTRNAITEAGLDPRAPWLGTKEDSLRNRFQYLCKKLHVQGRLHTSYSIHDLRHYCAIAHYTSHHDLLQLKDLLGHASTQVTEQYLRGLRSYLARTI